MWKKLKELKKETREDHNWENFFWKKRQQRAKKELYTKKDEKNSIQRALGESEWATIPGRYTRGTVSLRKLTSISHNSEVATFQTSKENFICCARSNLLVCLFLMLSWLFHTNKKILKHIRILFEIHTNRQIFAAGFIVIPQLLIMQLSFWPGPCPGLLCR